MSILHAHYLCSYCVLRMSIEIVGVCQGVCAFVCVSVNVQASDCHVRRRSNRPSKGWPVPLVLKTLNFPVVVTN